MSEEVDISKPPQFTVSFTYFGETQNAASRSVWRSELGYESYGHHIAVCLESVLNDSATFSERAARLAGAAMVWNMDHGTLDNNGEGFGPKSDPSWCPEARKEHDAWVKLLLAAEEYCLLMRSMNDGEEPS